MRLSLKKRRFSRQFARESYLEAKPLDNRKALFEQKCQAYGIDPATVITLLIYAMKLWKWWSERKVKDPSDRALSGEPRE